MSDSLLADLRALAEKWARSTRGIEEPDDWYGHQLLDLIAKHETEPDVSERDELARVIAHAYIDTGAQPALMADAILARGWRRR